MGTNAFLRGWINANHELADLVRHIVESTLREHERFGIDEERAAQFLKCWHYPTPSGPGGDFVLIGATVNIAELPLFVTKLSRIAEEVVDVDGDEMYYVAGRFEVTVDGQSDNEEWTIVDGRLDTSVRRPFFLSP